MNKKIFLKFAVLFLTAILMSCEGNANYDLKDNVYAEKHKLYSTKDTLYSGITIYYAKVKGHDVIYNVFSGKNKAQMDVMHFESECSQCKKIKK